jgi:orotidine-5'-phosphate decarboxylase
MKMIDRLIEKIEQYGNPTVVGLDPTIEMIPDFIKSEMFEKYGTTPKAVGQMFIKFNKEIIDGIKDVAPAVKPQIAMYEKYGLEGLNAYLKTIEYAKMQSLLVIGDIKRGDISSTATAYAAHIGGTEIQGKFFDLWKEDAITINPYLGFDGIEPFIKACNEKDKSIFVLVKTSNPSSGELQDLDSSGSKLYERVAGLVDLWGKLSMGEKGFSRIGAVVGATFMERGEELRRIMENTFFLVPGYGTQGGKGADLKGFFNKDGIGCIVNSSRGITAAYKNDKRFNENQFGEAAREAALLMKKDLQYV